MGGQSFSPATSGKTYPPYKEGRQDTGFIYFRTLFYPNWIERRCADQNLVKEHWGRDVDVKEEMEKRFFSHV